jgi:Lambda phage tail tube protein, TTP
MAKSKAFGTTVSVNATLITGINDITLSGAEVPFIDITTNDSTAKEFVAGLIDNGTLELTGKFDNASTGQDYLRANTGTSKAFIITLPSASTISFNAVIGAMNESISFEGTVDFSISCKVDGVKTYSV